jgi:cyanophycinase-like exopeptidase
MRQRFLVAVGLTVVAAAAPAPAGAAQGYVRYVVGNPADVVTATTPLLVLQGGGTDVDENFVRMGARSGGGDFVVIRASGADGYNAYILELCGCDSVETIVWKNRTASFDPSVIATVRNAEALFIAGGDQSRYVDFWKNTPIEDAINELMNVKKIPVGGTSAGMAVLGEHVYSAMSASSLDSAEGTPSTAISPSTATSSPRRTWA